MATTTALAPVPAAPRVLPVVWRAVVLAVLAALVALVAAAVVVPRLTGATPYTVLTGSMTPTYPPGTLVVVRPTDPADIAVGDVITYQLESGAAPVVTHRVVSVGVAAGSTGERLLRTRGDANSATDLEPVRAEQVRGRVWYALPHVGRVSLWFSPGQRQTAVTGVAIALLAYAGLALASTARDRRRSGREGRP